MEVNPTEMLRSHCRRDLAEGVICTEDHVDARAFSRTGDSATGDFSGTEIRRCAARLDRFILLVPAMGLLLTDSPTGGLSQAGSVVHVSDSSSKGPGVAA